MLSYDMQIRDVVQNTTCAEIKYQIQASTLNDFGLKTNKDLLPLRLSLLKQRGFEFAHYSNISLWFNEPNYRPARVKRGEVLRSVMPLAANVCASMLLFHPQLPKRPLWSNSTAHVLRPGGLSQDGQSGHRVREIGEDIYRDAVHIKNWLFWILFACACVRMSDWPGLNSAKTV